MTVKTAIEAARNSPRGSPVRTKDVRADVNSFTTGTQASAAVSLERMSDSCASL